MYIALVPISTPNRLPRFSFLDFLATAGPVADDAECDSNFNMRRASRATPSPLGRPVKATDGSAR
jgi:hypothetical protein